MRNSAFLIITALLLALGGFWFFSQGGADKPSGSLALENNGDPASALLEQPGELPKPQEEAGRKAEVASSDRSEAASASAATSPAPKTKETLNGRVVNGLGSAVVGAQVRIVPGDLFAEAFAFGAAGDPDGIDTRDGEAVTTDERGMFVIASNRRGEITFEVTCPNYAPLTVSRKVSAGNASEVGDLVIEQGVRLSGLVLDQSGSGIPGVEIRRGQPDSGGFRIRFSGQREALLATSGPSGEFEIDELMAGPYAITLNHALHPTLRAEGTTKRPGESVVGLRFVLEDGHSIAGVAREIPAGQHAKYVVRAYPSRDVSNAADSEDHYADMRLTEIANDGRFRFQGLREGTYRLQLIEAKGTEDMFANGQSSSVVAKTGDVDVELALREAMGVTFRVVDASSGEPCITYAASVGDTIFGARTLQETEHEDGRTTVESVDVRGDSSLADIHVRAAGYTPATLENVDLMPGVVKDIGVIRLERAPTITVEVLDATTKQPIQGARVSLSKMMVDRMGSGRRMSFSMGGEGDTEGEEGEEPDLGALIGGGSNRAKTDENGLAEVASLPGQRCQISAKHGDYADGELLDLELPLAADERYTLLMTRGGTVTVTVYDADGNLAKGVPVVQTLVSESAPLIFGGGGGRKSRKDGTLVFKHLSPGTHNFKISEPGGAGGFNTNGAQVVIMGGPDDSVDPGEDVLVTEGADLQVTLRKKPEGSLAGKLTEVGEPLAGANLAFKAKSSGRPVGMMGMPDFGGGKEVMTNGAGSFLMEGLTVGTYTVTVTHPDRIMPIEYEAEIRAGKNKQDYDLPLAILEGRVTDPEGKPIVGIDVSPTRYRAAGSQQGTRVMMAMIRSDGGGGAVTMSTGPAEGSARTDEEGRYTLRGVTPEVDLVVESSSSKYQKGQSQKVSVAQNETRSNVDLTLEAAGSVTVTVRNPDGSPAEFVIVSLDYAGEAEPMPEQQREFTGETGLATARGLRPGFWRVSGRTVSMGPGGANSDERTTETAEVEIVAWETAELTLELD